MNTTIRIISAVLAFFSCIGPSHSTGTSDWNICMLESPRMYKTVTVSKVDAQSYIKSNQAMKGNCRNRSLCKKLCSSYAWFEVKKSNTCTCLGTENNDKPPIPTPTVAPAAAPTAAPMLGRPLGWTFAPTYEGENRCGNRWGNMCGPNSSCTLTATGICGFGGPHDGCSYTTEPTTPVPPTSVPPASLPSASVPPTSVPPTSVPPTSKPTAEP
jgi:hypothetical protein